MKIYIKLLLVIGIALSTQGCISHNVKPVDLSSIENTNQYIIANQDFKCQNAFLGAAHKYLVNKDDLFKASKLPEGMEVSSFGELSGGQVDKRAIFLKHSDAMNRDFGFLVFPDGTFVYDRGEEQFGVVGPYGASDEFMFNINCEWSGKTPFQALSDEKLKLLRGH